MRPSARYRRPSGRPTRAPCRASARSWQYAERTLTSAAGISAADVWAYAKRSLTTLKGLLPSGWVVTAGTPYKGKVQIYQGDDYTGTRAIPFSDETWPDLTGKTLEVKIEDALGDGVDYEGDADGADASLTVPIGSEDTAEFVLEDVDVAHRAKAVPLGRRMTVRVVDEGEEQVLVDGIAEILEPL